MTKKPHLYRLPQYFWNSVAFGQAPDAWMAKALGVARGTIHEMREFRKIAACKDKNKFALFTRDPYSPHAWHLVDWSLSNAEISVFFECRVTVERVAFVRRHRYDLACPHIPTYALIEELLCPASKTE